jgi:outer membrane protein assembly complex protein YaeT
LRGRTRITPVIAWLVAAAGVAAAQEQAREGMPIRDVELVGLHSISEGFVRRTIKTRVGQSYQPLQTQDDVRELVRTRKFLNVFASARVEQGQVIVTFTMQEKPEIASIELEGNKAFSNSDLFKEVTVTPQTPIDRYEINRSADNLVQKYRQNGYYYAQVTLDETALSGERRVVFRITEGPRVRVRRIELEGLRSFPRILLLFKIRTQTWFWIFRKGAFDEELAERDVQELQTFYRNEGFLDARVGYRLDFDDVNRADLTLVFVIEEGVRYRVHDIRFRGNVTIPTETLRAALALQPGDLARDESIQANRRIVEDKFGEIGFVDVSVEPVYDYLEQPGRVIVTYDIREGARARFGRITIRGNEYTKDEVIRRELRFYPLEDYNTVKARKAEQSLSETGLFKKATITPLRDENGLREALVEVEEADAINIIFGIGVSTDSGVLGSVTILNKNFDLLDWPRNWGEFFGGQSFRGDGQRLRLQAEPGSEVSRFRIDFTEPYLFDQPLRLDTSFYLFQRGRDSYDEQRLGFVPSLGRRFETGPLDGWAVEGALRFELIDIDDVNPLAARDIRAVRGNSSLTAVKGTIVRDRTDSRIIPTTGYRVAFSWEQVGALGGDYAFAKPSVSSAIYRTIATDAFDRKSVLALRADAGWIVADAPTFERYYGGGFGSIRGFSYRGISPRQGIYNDRVGGNFILLTGAEYSFPLYANNIRGVTFLDMGTVEESFEITSWRASVGFGLRIVVDFFGPVPIVLDFGFPIAKDDEDDTQVFNFSFGASF